MYELSLIFIYLRYLFLIAKNGVEEEEPKKKAGLWDEDDDDNLFAGSVPKPSKSVSSGMLFDEGEEWKK